MCATDELPQICNISKYSEDRTFTIWEVNDVPERKFDFKSLTTNQNYNLITHITKIIDLILKYKIVYFVNLPLDYFELFEIVNNEFHERIKRDVVSHQ